MEFRIADTFTASLAKLNVQEQKLVKTTAFDLQMNPANPGLKFHRLDKVKDPNFWSVRVSRDIRIIVHKTYFNLLLCYVDHHDKAYEWAERRKLETHPKTGAAQIIEVREMVKEIFVPKYVEETVVQRKKLLFEDFEDDQLLSYGVPEEWLSDVKEADEDSILELADHLPAEAAEALLEIAVGGTPPVLEPLHTDNADPFEHPDAQRRFRIMSNKEELERALDYPWEQWTVFLHPDQKEIVEKDFSGPARVSGSAGTGKTVVALHRAVFLTKSNPDARVLLTTFSKPLANALQLKLRRLISNSPRLGERLEVADMDSIGERLYAVHGQGAKLATTKRVSEIITEMSASGIDHKFSQHFLQTEWKDVVDAWQISSWEEYRDVRRLGRKTRLPEKQRMLLWEIFSAVRAQLISDNVMTSAQMFSDVATALAAVNHPPFDYVVVDEAQDVSVPQLRFLSTLGGDRQNSLFFAGDLGQRIFQQPFSWKALGVNIQGRSCTLRINYRTSHQIRMKADMLLAKEITDVDGNSDKRNNTISVFNGPKPMMKIYDSQDEELSAVSQWLKGLQDENLTPAEIGVFVRSSEEIPRAISAVDAAGLPYKVLDEKIEISSGNVSISTMHLAKGLEFRAVAVMACDDEIIPSMQRIEAVGDDTDLEEVYNTERHLLYVACTRARDQLFVSGIDPVSEFVDDLMI